MNIGRHAQSLSENNIIIIISNSENIFQIVPAKRFL